MELALQKRLFGLSSSLTTRFPRAGARLLDGAIKPILTNPLVGARWASLNRAALDRVGRPRRVLVLADVHLGDALTLQGLVIAARDFLPTAEIHYVVSRDARPFLEGHPDVSRLWPLYTGSPFPSAADVAAVRRLIATVGCDLVANACPFLALDDPPGLQPPILDFVTHGPHLLRNEDARLEPNHFLFQTHRFLADLFRERWPSQRPDAVRGASIFLDDDAVDEADAFVASVPADRATPWVLLNPDAASPYTRPPLSVLLPLVRRLIDGGFFILVGEGHTDSGVGIRLRDALSPAQRARTHPVPASLSAPAYAATLDRVDAFISGDTGPLHWGAARKISRSGGRRFANRTAVFSLFGATPARMSGYDSMEAGFLPAWQDAASSAFVSHAPCLNITCLNKLHKTCGTVRCFEGCSPLEIADAVLARTVGRRPVASSQARCVQA